MAISVPLTRIGKVSRAKKWNRYENRALDAGHIRELLAAIDSVRDDAMIRLGLSVGLRVSEVVTILPTNIDFERGTIWIWDKKKSRNDKEEWRLVYPTVETMSAIRRYLNTLEEQSQFVFPISEKTAERVIQKYSTQALGFTISWHSLRTTYITRSSTLGQNLAVVMTNTGDRAVTILRYYTKLPEETMKRFVQEKPVIPREIV